MRKRYRVLASLIVIITAICSFILYELAPKVIAKANVGDYEARLYGKTSWDNWCTLTKLDITNKTTHKTQSIALSSTTHCLNGTGSARYDWLKVHDFNSDGNPDIRFFTGFNTATEDGYSTIIYDPHTSQFIRGIDL